ncbi:MAG: ROK family protein [Phycisphaerae bacterium]|nr:ROK family protein [Phycisphaerae bacterium]
MGQLLLGIDLGGTNIKIGCFDSSLNVIEKTSIVTNSESGPETVIENIVTVSLALVEQANLRFENVAAIGVGVPGPTDYETGTIIKLPNMPAFENLPLKKLLEEKCCKKVVIENDANAACWGEFTIGSGSDVKDMVFFTLGTGIGGGIISDGKMLRGTSFGAAELGHLIIFPDGRKCACGQKGCVEAYASASNTAARALEALGKGRESSLKNVLENKGTITCKDVYDHLEGGDGLAKEITDLTAEALALTCINMLHVTDPEKFVFAGGMIAAGNILLERIRYYFDQMIWKMKKETVEICFAQLGEDAGIIGAAALAKELV